MEREKDSNNKKNHLLSLNKVIVPYEKGGIGITEPTLMNTTLGENILWRFVTEGNS